MLTRYWADGLVVMCGLSVAGRAQGPSCFPKCRTFQNSESHLERYLFLSSALLPLPSRPLFSCIPAPSQPRMQLETTPGAAPEMCPDKLTQFNPDGERQESMGFPHPGTATHAASVSTHVTFSLRRRKQQRVHRSSPALLIQLNNSSAPVTSQQLAGVGFLLCSAQRAQPHISMHPKRGELSSIPTSSSFHHPIPPPERRALQPCSPLTCFLQVHGGGCLSCCSSRCLSGGCRRLLRGRSRGLGLLSPLAPRVPQGLGPPGETNRSGS